jgi:peptide deformylase
MILPVEVYGSNVLRKRSLDIDKEYKGLDLLINDMFETMCNSDGVGLAAPQIGKNIRLIVIDANPMKEEDESLEGFKQVLINPVIIEESGDHFSYNEGCLSLPGIREDVTRQETIRIAYKDEQFKHHEKIFKGIKARIMQHEYDHLEGVLFIDRVSALKKKLLRRKLNDITKGKVDTTYRIRIPVK